MFDKNKIDSFFDNPIDVKSNKRTLSEKIRILFPLVALVLLSLLVVVPIIKNQETSFAFQITIPKKGELEKLMVDKLDFYITNKDNQVQNFKAKHIEEVDAENKITKLDDLDAVFNNNVGDWLNMKTNEGYFYQNQNLLKLPNIVDIFYTQGFEMNATEVVADFNTNKVFSKAPTFGEGFLGDVEADGFEIDLKKEIITFIGNVKLKKSEVK
ncbi:MAG: LPS export ABC transporter periplasmic protein LptC [Alphaproteobacteria bacterium]